MSIIEKHIKEIRKLCRKHQVGKLFVFGSFNSGRFNKDSDIDFLVSFADVDIHDYADNYFDFKYSLENILKREVDLLEEKAIKNPYLRESIDSSKKLVYG
ncbi:MAG: nucleotidyltransferase domain-containing protein [Bacteroidales bacterium]|nr:nucleotidyltransferase domain-containing protein [Bacteroidales bacterium]MCF8337299.1 nucleotidyltransferase domain-containing protein [Bacteroidales bacterium]